MTIIDRLEAESRVRVLTDEESSALADAVRREKNNASRRARYRATKESRAARVRERYASDPEYRRRILNKNEASRKRNARRAISTVGLSPLNPENVLNREPV